MVVDGIEKLVGKDGTQAFFLDILEHHLAQGSQVVASANSAHPLGELSPEIISRLSGGLEVRIEHPDTELNSQVIAQFAKQRNLNLLPEAIEYLASRAGADVRALFGSVARVAAETRFHVAGGSEPVQVSRAMAEEAARDRLVAPSPKLAGPDDVLRAIGDAFGTSPDALKRSGRKNAVVTAARDAAAYLLREESGMTTTAAGVFLGGRSHSTIIEAQKRHEQKRDSDPALLQTEAEARRLLRAKVMRR